MNPTTSTTATRQWLMLDHPGWLKSPDGRVRRAFRDGDQTWSIVCDPLTGDDSPTSAEVSPSAASSKATGDWFDPATLPPPLCDAAPIRTIGRRFRVRNHDLWDALLPLMLRHRRRAIDATRSYRDLCDAHGTSLSTNGNRALLAPRPEIVAGLSDHAFKALGLRGMGARLRTVAAGCATRSNTWRRLSHAELFLDLQAIPYVGMWTAGAAMADLTNNFGYYTFGGTPAHRSPHEILNEIIRQLCPHEFIAGAPKVTSEQLSTLVGLVTAIP